MSENVCITTKFDSSRDDVSGGICTWILATAVETLSNSVLQGNLNPFSGAMDWRLPGIRELLRLAALQGGVRPNGVGTS
ncbi:hypothetical protein [Nocardia sp. NPDC046763]|uniref:hypothetical protein n=1 Tax=Nocardia sp. NPDC046763 TaxID=3155256 RepID=UPI003402B2DE